MRVLYVSTSSQKRCCQLKVNDKDVEKRQKLDTIIIVLIIFCFTFVETTFGVYRNMTILCLKVKDNERYNAYSNFLVQ